MIPQQEPCLENEIGTFALPAGQKKQSAAFSGEYNCLRGKNAHIERALQRHNHLEYISRTGKTVNPNSGLAGYELLEPVFPARVHVGVTYIPVNIATIIIIGFL